MYDWIEFDPQKKYIEEKKCSRGLIMYEIETIIILERNYLY